MVKVEIEAEKRETLGKKNKKLKIKGFVPAVIYGRKFSPVSISINLREFQKKILLSDAGLNLLFTLKIKEGENSKEVPAITRALQRNHLTDEIIHLDFMQVAMDEVIKARVPVELKGLPIGVKDSGGVLVHGLREIEIKCLPGDIPEKFEIDVSNLVIGNSLHVADIQITKKIEILSPLNEMVATVSAPTKEEEVVAPTPTPEEAAAAAETATAVAEEQVKEKSAPGGAPAKEKSAPKEK
jgi:large subunit ribosomal protein L25